ncbi:MAG: class I mannose-6-phosphate isomerase [Myxococcales bacterium]|nr:class I mannose-6-phosphate isomerase [Myxococcales bacterium]
MIRPRLLRADNFTPPARTPWGGTRLRARFKGGAPLAADKAAYRVVGESWEVSVEPDFPSVDAEDERTLAAHIADDPRGWLGDADGFDLLVKLLDADDALSVQIHPSDDDAALAEDEGGKPESWYVLAAEPGAGLYLGFEEGVDEAAVRATLEAQGDLSALLHFVPVAPGDVFVIDAGTPHAIGPGVTLVERQRVRAGRRGLTYRYWDWNRRYDANGRRNAGGAPRALHVERALAVTRWDAPRGEALLERIRLRAGAADLEAAARVEPLAGPDGPVRFAPLEVARICGTGTTTLPAAPYPRGLTVVEGAVTLRGDDWQVRAERGRSVAVPAGVGAVEVALEHGHAIIAAAP